MVAKEGGEREQSNKEKEGGEVEEIDEEIRVDELVAAVREQARALWSDKGKAKMVEEEEVPAEKQPIYLEELGTAIPANELEFNLSQTFERRQLGTGVEAEELDFRPEGERDWTDDYYWNIRYLGDAPAAESASLVRSGNGNAGAGEEGEELEQEEGGATIGGGEPEDMDNSRTPEESAASTGTYDAWKKPSKKGRSEIKKKGKPPPPMQSLNDNERFQGNAAARAHYDSLNKKGVVLDRGFVGEMNDHRLISNFVATNSW